jgi:hypothetical protein
VLTPESATMTVPTWYVPAHSPNFPEVGGETVAWLP